MNKTLFSIMIFTSLSFASSYKPLANINGSTGMVFPKDTLKMVLITDSFTKNKAYDGSIEVNDNKNRSSRVDVVKYKIRYGFGNNFDMTLVVPYVNKKSYSINPITQKKYNYLNSGIGDSFIFTRYQLLNQKKGDSIFSSVGFIIKLPTGDTSKEFDTPQGDKKIATMQLGTGSTDFLVMLGVSKLLSNSRIDSSVLYHYTTKGDNNYEFGDKIQWNIGYSYAVTSKFDLQLELNGRHFKKDIEDSIILDYTGGNFYYVTPGIHYKITKGINISAGYAYIVKRDNNYDSKTKIGGLSEDSRFTFRLGYSF